MYQQQSFSGPQQTEQGQHYHLQEQDAAGVVLCELKRVAREYTTAALESSQPAIRQTFAILTQRTLQDHAELSRILSQMQEDSAVRPASLQEIQQELQQQIRRAEQMQSLVQEALQSGSTAAVVYQQQGQQLTQQQRNVVGQNPYYQSSQSYPSGYAGAPTGYGGQGAESYAAMSGSSQFYPFGYAGAATGYPSQGTSSSGLGAGAPYGNQDFAQSGTWEYGPSVYQGLVSGGFGPEEHNYPKRSSVGGTDQQEYYSETTTQAYTNNDYSSRVVEDAFNTSNDQKQTSSWIASSPPLDAGAATAGQNSGRSNRSAKTQVGASPTAASRSASAKRGSRQQGGSTAHSSKYMI